MATLRASIRSTDTIATTGPFTSHTESIFAKSALRWLVESDEDPVEEFRPDWCSAPGATLLDMLEERKMPREALAVALGLPLLQMDELLEGKAPLTPDLALQLEDLFGGPSAEFWVRREALFRLCLVRNQKFICQWCPADEGAMELVFSNECTDETGRTILICDGCLEMADLLEEDK